MRLRIKAQRSFPTIHGSVVFTTNEYALSYILVSKPFTPTPQPTKKTRPTKPPSNSNNSSEDGVITDECKSELQATTQCTADCEASSTGGAYYAVGNQTFIDPCKPQVTEIISQFCHGKLYYYNI